MLTSFSMEPLSLSGKRWHIPHDVCASMEDLIKQRLRNLEDTGDRWNDPTVFPESVKAAERVQRAIKNKETIAIFGDYDCDGITSTAQMLRYFRRHGVEPIVKLPHRLHDGYGLREKHVDAFADAGVTLLVTVDTGVSAHEALARAREQGIDVIILDHHHVTKTPDAYAVLHPALAENFPGAHPSAAGVTFLFLRALEGADWTDRNTNITLAMIGTIADLVPLSGINRRIVQEGLRVLPTLPQSPLKELIDAVSRGKPLTSIDIAFRIAPRINAAGRMDDPMIGLRAILDGGSDLQMLEALNVSRQEETLRCTEHAIGQIEQLCHPEPVEGRTLPSFLAVADPSYQAGIIGLIAGKLTEKFGRPSMAVSIQNEMCTASLRSPTCYNIVEGLGRVSHLLTTFGGHAQAAGCSFPLDHFLELSDALAADVASNVPEELLSPTLTIDATLDAADISFQSIRKLQKLEPFGQGNHEPVFLIRNARMSSVRCVGNEGAHLQATIGASKLIGFNHGDWREEAQSPVDIVCRVGIDTWQNRESVQLFLQDMRIAQEAFINR